MIQLKEELSSLYSESFSNDQKTMLQKKEAELAQMEKKFQTLFDEWALLTEKSL